MALISCPYQVRIFCDLAHYNPSPRSGQSLSERLAAATRQNPSSLGPFLAKRSKVGKRFPLGHPPLIRSWRVLWLLATDGFHDEHRASAREKNNSCKLSPGCDILTGRSKFRQTFRKTDRLRGTLPSRFCACPLERPRPDVGALSRHSNN